MRLLFPIILLLASVGLFAMFTSPTYQGLKSHMTQVEAYDDALDKSQELRTLRDRLQSTRNAFSPQDEQKLTRLLPDQVDNIRLIIDINNIASRRGLALSGVELGDVSNTSSDANKLAVGPSSDPVGSVSLGFSVTATYEEFLSFLQDVEHSLRILDVENLSFEAAPAGKYAFDFTIRTYWLH